MFGNRNIVKPVRGICDQYATFLRMGSRGIEVQRKWYPERTAPYSMGRHIGPFEAPTAHNLPSICSSRSRLQSYTQPHFSQRETELLNTARWDNSWGKRLMARERYKYNNITK